MDEISDLEKRRQLCQWIENARIGLKNACFVLTTRPTGFRKTDGLELECHHLRADILDFSWQQQERFLYQCFRAVFLNELPPGAHKKDKDKKEKEADARAYWFWLSCLDMVIKQERKIQEVKQVADIYRSKPPDSYFPGLKTYIFTY